MCDLTGASFLRNVYLKTAEARSQHKLRRPSHHSSWRWGLLAVIKLIAVSSLGFACCNKADSCFLVAVVSYLPECSPHNLKHLFCTITYFVPSHTFPYCLQHLLYISTHISILLATSTLYHHTHFHTACNTYSTPSHTFPYCLQHLLFTITHIFILLETPTLYLHTHFHTACNTYSTPSHTFPYCFNTYSIPSHTSSYYLQHLLYTITHIFILLATPTLYHHTSFYNAVSMSFTER